MAPSDTTVDESAREREHRGGRPLGELLSEAKGRAREFREHYVDDAWARSREWVSRNPGKSVLISAAVGMLLGGLLLRRRR